MGLRPAPGFVDVAVDAARWIDTIDPASTGTTLYAGLPGHILFQLELHRFLGEPKYLRMARAGADALLARLPNEREAGLYEGIAGVGFTLGEAYRATRDVAYRDGCVRAVRWLQDHARRAGLGIQWNDRADIYDGSSGTALFALWAARVLEVPGARDLALAAGRRALDAVDKGLPMPNFSHGLAGIGYFLATLYCDTGARAFLYAAVEAARELQSIAITRGDRCLIRHDDSAAGESLYYLSWCHGPAGTARLFYRLWQATHDSDWMAWVHRSARTLVTSAPGTVVVPGEWDNVGLCCGVAGQAEFLLGCYTVTGKMDYLDAAQKAAAYLASKATRDEDGARWIQAEHRVQPDLREPQSGYMQGASGIGTCLLHASFPVRLKDAVRLPDDPFTS
jgi:lantibiotic modifying enzyme